VKLVIYDCEGEIWVQADLNPDSFGYHHAGYGLDAVSIANGVGGKSGNGALAPVLWQQGKRGAVIDYCLRDVMLTKKCIERALASSLICPKTGGPMMINVQPLFATGAGVP
jgi:hypothetical protein